MKEPTTTKKEVFMDSTWLLIFLGERKYLSYVYIFGTVKPPKKRILREVTSVALSWWYHKWYRLVGHRSYMLSSYDIAACVFCSFITCCFREGVLGLSIVQVPFETKFTRNFLFAMFSRERCEHESEDTFVENVLIGLRE